MDFDNIALIEVPVTLGGKKYILREASGAVANQYGNAQTASMVLNEDGKPQKIVGIMDANSLLVSLCLFECGPEGTPFPSPVSQQFVKGLPAKVQKALTAKVGEISEMGDDTEESLKKEMAILERKLASLRKDHVGNVQSDTPVGTT
jgi:hypothetical protein